jgi:hypothetical protein
MLPSKFAPLTPAQEEIAIEAVIALGLTPIMSPLPAHAVAESLGVTQEQGEAILQNLSDRNLTESRFEHPGNNLVETGHVIVNHRSKWVRVEQV